jgi:hypothetical protein
MSPVTGHGNHTANPYSGTTGEGVPDFLFYFGFEFYCDTPLASCAICCASHVCVMAHITTANCASDRDKWTPLRSCGRSIACIGREHVEGLAA